MAQNFTQYSFTDSVKDLQEKYGSRKAYGRMEEMDQYELSSFDIDFIQSRDSFYLSTVGENGWPYVQFRGGPKGFLKAINSTKLAFADFRGNRQYISTGNMNSTKKAALILVDYTTKRRLKIWAETTIIEADEAPELLEAVTMPDYPAKIERLVIFDVKAFDWNCPQHITQKFSVDELKQIAKDDPEFIKSLLSEN